MVEADRARFSATIGALAEAFERDVTEGMIESYWLGLEELPFDAVQRAAKDCLRTCRFMPRIAEIREKALGPTKLLAAEQWKKVVPHIGGSSRTEPLDPIAEKVVGFLGGLWVLGSKSSDELHTWTAKRFAELYEEFAASSEGQELLADGSAGRLGTGNGNQRDAERLVDETSRKLGTEGDE